MQTVMFRIQTWPVQSIFNEKNLTDCISHSPNTLGKGMNPIILLPAMGK